MKYILLPVLLNSIFVFSQNVKILEHHNSVKIEPIDQLNSSNRECNLSVSPNGDELFFMSTRSSHKKNGGNGDLYKSTLDNNGNWSNPKSINDLNTSNGEDEPSISQTGETLYFQSWADPWVSTGGPYYEANYKNGNFETKKGLGGGINNFFYNEYKNNLGYATDGMSVSSDGNLFIVACGPNYYGNMDLYYSEKINNQWSYLKKLDISTPGDERGVFIAADNKTIYFASNGYDGFGGLDIYKTTIEKGKTSSVINIGNPFNSKENDMGFVISENGNSAFLIRNLDIYFADLTNLENDIKPVQDIITDTLILEKTEIIDKEHKSMSYTLFFDYNSYSLNDEATKTLNQILEIKDIGNRKMSIKGHTDNTGDEKYNLKLSKSRVNSVQNWLMKAGIVTTMVDFKGENEPLMPNDNPINRSRNRRVEIVIE